MADTIYADWVSDAVRIPRLEQMVDFMRRPTSTCDVGNFHLLHYGDGDHMYHLELIPGLWRVYGLGNGLHTPH